MVYTRFQAKNEGHIFYLCKNLDLIVFLTYVSSCLAPTPLSKKRWHIPDWRRYFGGVDSKASYMRRINTSCSFMKIGRLVNDAFWHNRRIRHAFIRSDDGLC
jgi:hypothetical protein